MAGTSASASSRFFFARASGDASSSPLALPCADRGGRRASTAYEAKSRDAAAADLLFLLLGLAVDRDEQFGVALVLCS